MKHKSILALRKRKFWWTVSTGQFWGARPKYERKIVKDFSSDWIFQGPSHVRSMIALGKKKLISIREKLVHTIQGKSKN